MNLSFSRPSIALPRVAGSAVIFLAFFSSSDNSKILQLTLSGGVSPLLIPSSPAERHTANARYGLAAESGQRSSTLVPFPLAAGTRINGLLFFAYHAT